MSLLWPGSCKMWEENRPIPDSLKASVLLGSLIHVSKHLFGNNAPKKLDTAIGRGRPAPCALSKARSRIIMLTNSPMSPTSIKAAFGDSSFDQPRSTPKGARTVEAFSPCSCRHWYQRRSAGTKNKGHLPDSVKSQRTGTYSWPLPEAWCDAGRSPWTDPSQALCGRQAPSRRLLKDSYFSKELPAGDGRNWATFGGTHHSGWYHGLEAGPWRTGICMPAHQSYPPSIVVE